jgi:hypothetical protein
MAKNKYEEVKYKAEYLRRRHIRLNERTIIWRERGRRGGGSIHYGKKCPDCNGYMAWCEICDVYTKICCVDYGTCQCS